MAGMELKTPKWFSNGSVEDFTEAIKYLLDKHQPKKVCAIGISLGGSVLAQAVAKNEFKIDAAVC
jgi:predicted alpha/beta-fold hydrolase